MRSRLLVYKNISWLFNPDFEFFFFAFLYLVYEIRYHIKIRSIFDWFGISEKLSSENSLKPIVK